MRSANPKQPKRRRRSSDVPARRKRQPPFRAPDGIRLPSHFAIQGVRLPKPEKLIIQANPGHSFMSLFLAFLWDVTWLARVPYQKFTALVLLGILGCRNPQLAAISRWIARNKATTGSLKPGSIRRRLEERLNSDVLSTEDMVQRGLMRWSKRIKARNGTEPFTILITDDTDVILPRANLNREHGPELLSLVRDGSRSKKGEPKGTVIGPGYEASCIAHYDPDVDEVTPLYFRLRLPKSFERNGRRIETGYISQNDEWRKGLQPVLPHLPANALLLCDRGYDGAPTFGMLDMLGIQYAVRLNAGSNSRRLHRTGRTKATSATMTVQDHLRGLKWTGSVAPVHETRTKYTHAPTRRTETWRTAWFMAQLVERSRPSGPLRTVLVLDHGRPQPIVLLCSRVLTAEERQYVGRMYIKRNRVENLFQYFKSRDYGLNFERICVRRFVARQRMLDLFTLIGLFIGEVQARDPDVYLKVVERAMHERKSHGTRYRFFAGMQWFLLDVPAFRLRRCTERP